MSFECQSTAFEVDGEMSNELRLKIQAWADSVCPGHGCTLRIIDKVFDNDEAAMRYTYNCYGPYLLALRYRCVETNREAIRGLYVRREALCVRKRKLLMEIAPWNRTSKTMSCKKCGTRYVCSELKQNEQYNCGMCGEFLLSATNREKLSSVNMGIAEIDRRLELAGRGYPTGKTAWYVECTYIVD